MFEKYIKERLDAVERKEDEISVKDEFFDDLDKPFIENNE